MSEGLKRAGLLPFALLIAVAFAASIGSGKTSRVGTDAIDTPQLLNFQGKLVPGGTGITVGFAIFDAAVGGTQVWPTSGTEDHTVTTDPQGVFNVILGTTLPVVVPDGPDCYLEITVAGSAVTPRTRLVSVPYAYNAAAALVADQLDGQHASAFSLTSHTHSIYEQTANKGAANGYAGLNASAKLALGTIDQGGAATSQVLKWNGAAWAPGNDVGGSNYWTDNTTYLLPNDNANIRMYDNGNTYAVYGATSTANGYGVYGNSSAAWGVGGYGAFAGVAGRGPSIGTAGTSDGSGGWGVYGYAPAGVGVYGYGSTNGVLGYSGASYGYGVYGYQYPYGYGVYGNGYYYGVYGYSPANSAYGVYGYGYAAYAYGVYGYTTNTAASGVVGYNSGANTIGVLAPGYYLVNGYAGVWGGSGASGGFGVYGTGFIDGYGVFGFGRYGVYGAASGTNYTGVQGCGLYGVVGAGYSNPPTNGYGVYGYMLSGNVGWGVRGDGNPAGVYGYSSASGVFGYSTANVGVSGTGNYAGGYFYSSSTGYSAYTAFSSYKIYGTGTVSTYIIDENDKERTLHCPEAPEVVFEDYGSAQLQNGYCRVDLDPLFLRGVVISEQFPLRVYVTPKGREPVAVSAESHDSYFEVFGPAGSNVAFDWRIVANRAGYQNLRFEAHERPANRRANLSRHR